MNPIRKGLVIGVILLFIGLAFAPSINANTQSDFVEFTTEVCGLSGGKQTVKLTQEEADEVEALFNSIREQLNDTDSRVEAEEIFKDAVVELDKYGLLGGLSVKQAHRLVTGSDWYSKLTFDNYCSQDEDKLDNMFCLIAGKANALTFFNGLINRCLFLMCELAFHDDSFMIMGYLFFLFYYLTLIRDLVKPIKLRENICYGAYVISPEGSGKEPAKGEIITLGIFGKQSMSGEYYGSIYRNLVFGPGKLYTGVYGFKGLSFLLPRHGLYYFGHALLVGLQR